MPAERRLAPRRSYAHCETLPTNGGNGRNSQVQAQAAPSEEVLGKQLRAALQTMEQALASEVPAWLGLEGPGRSRPSSAGNLMKRPTRKSTKALLSPRHLESFAAEARKCVKVHCERQAHVKVSEFRKRLMQRIQDHLQDLVVHRDQLAPNARGVDVTLKEEEEKELFRPLKHWPEEEQKVMKAVMQERVIQLLSLNRREPGSDSESESSKAPTESEDSGLDDDVKRGLKRLQRPELGNFHETEAPPPPPPKEKKKRPPVVDKQAEAELARRLKELEELRKQLEEWRKRRQNAEADVADLKKQIAELEAEKARLEKLLRELEEEKRRVEAALKAAQDRDAQKAAANKAAVASAKRQAEDAQKANAEAEAKRKKEAAEAAAAAAAAAAAEAAEAAEAARLAKLAAQQVNLEPEVETVYEDDPEARAAAEAEARAKARKAVEGVEKAWAKDKEALTIRIAELEVELAEVQELLRVQEEREAQEARRQQDRVAALPIQVSAQTMPSSELSSELAVAGVSESLMQENSVHQVGGSPSTYRAAAKDLSVRVFSRLAEDTKARAEKQKENIARHLMEQENNWLRRLRGYTGTVDGTGRWPVEGGGQPKPRLAEEEDEPPREAKLRVRLQGPLPVLDLPSDKDLQAGASRMSSESSARHGSGVAMKPLKLDPESLMEPAIKQVLSTGRLPTSASLSLQQVPSHGPALFRSFTPAALLPGGEAGWVPESQKPPDTRSVFTS